MLKLNSQKLPENGEKYFNAEIKVKPNDDPYDLTDIEKEDTYKTKRLDLSPETLEYLNLSLLNCYFSYYRINFNFNFCKRYRKKIKVLYHAAICMSAGELPK